MGNTKPDTKLRKLRNHYQLFEDGPIAPTLMHLIGKFTRKARASWDAREQQRREYAAEKEEKSWR